MSRPHTGRWLEELTPGLVIEHAIRRTITEADNVLFTSITMNPAWIHLDFDYAQRETSYGKPLVNSMLTVAMVVGISVHETTLGTTVVWGRLYCGRLCAFGALTQLMDLLVPKKWQVTVPATWERNAFYFKYALLAFVLVYYFTTHQILVSRYVEPFWMFGLSGRPIMWTMLGILLFATVFVRNMYCRFLCPVGATLGLMSYLTVFRIKRWSECTNCKICQKTCQWGAIEGPKILVTECVRCDDCERMYADTAKCPHWRIIDYKNRKVQVLPLRKIEA